LIEISPSPNKDNCVIQMHPRDNVAVARVPLQPGRAVRAGGVEVIVGEPVPAGHKVALTALEAGAIVLRYGQSIGRAGRRIEAGEHVHVQNLRYEEPSLVFEFPAEERKAARAPLGGPAFLGYRRPDGRAGTRNYIALVAASNCAAHVVERVARHFEGRTLPPGVDGVAAFPHGHGCGGLTGRDGAMLHRTLAGVMDHPNVFGAILIGLGCETNQIGPYLSAAGVDKLRLAGLTMQAGGGTTSTVEEACRQVSRWMDEAASVKRVELPGAEIVLGLNCGGSDSFSGITANPALGYCSDLVAELGGSTVLGETPEIVGAEHLLVRRARNREVGERLLGCIARYQQYLSRFGGSFDDNPSPGNKEGGLSNILEKSLGAVAKGGTSRLIDVVDYAARVELPGFAFMNTPGYDPVSLTGLAAGGCNLVAFTTGRGSAIGFPTVPVIKIATNSRTYRRMVDNMDVNAGTIADGEATVETVGREIFDLVLAVASGQRSCAERLGHREFVPWRIGPVM
jgi:altronate hydrolase